MTVKVGLQLAPQHGAYEKMRDAWMEADSIGADVLWSADHFFAQEFSVEQIAAAKNDRTGNAENYEGMCIQAAMAATTKRAQIGALIMAIGFRNPNLLADMARTIDHISGGRFILGLGAGYIQREYEEYGYEFGTQKSRLLDLEAAIPVIRNRFEKLNPPPVKKIPILIGSMGDKIGLRIVAQQADMWHMVGPMEKMRAKHKTLLKWCEEVGRDPSEIEVVANLLPQYFKDNDPDILLKEHGIKHFNLLTIGPDWDLGLLREMLEWKKSVAA